MRKVNIRQLRSNLAKELSNLPFVITKNGKPIAKVNKRPEPNKAGVLRLTDYLKPDNSS